MNTPFHKNVKNPKKIRLISLCHIFEKKNLHTYLKRLSDKNQVNNNWKFFRSFSNKRQDL